MAQRKGRDAFTLVELLVMIAIIGVLVGLLFAGYWPDSRRDAKITMARSMLSSLEIALAEYRKDTGVYPPEVGPGNLDKCSETLYFYLAGQDVQSSKKAVEERLRAERAAATTYFDFKKEFLADYDGDGRYEVLDSWELPWIYISGTWQRPRHNAAKYDLYSVGADGRTGRNWPTRQPSLRLGPGDPGSFYHIAADDADDGYSDGPCKDSDDDLSNF